MRRAPELHCERRDRPCLQLPTVVRPALWQALRRISAHGSFGTSVVVIECDTCLSKRSERRTHLRRGKLRLLPGGKVAALVDFVEVAQVAIGAPGPGLRGAIDVRRKHGDGDRKRDLGGLL